MKGLFTVGIFILLCELVGIISTPFTLSSIPTWYVFLHKPFFSPPNWVFGPVWTLLYFLMGVAASLIWEKGRKSKKGKIALRYFFLQLTLNFLWSVVFFGLHFPLGGLLDIAILLGVIIVMVRKFYTISKMAAYLLIPYVAWVSFATILNLFIVLLNS